MNTLSHVSLCTGWSSYGLESSNGLNPNSPSSGRKFSKFNRLESFNGLNPNSSRSWRIQLVYLDLLYYLVVACKASESCADKYALISLCVVFSQSVGIWWSIMWWLSRHVIVPEK